ncbi:MULTISPECIES: hypothetical protein [unclassified Streptomyces]|uniref:hypothetical protein n=1 Tax=unclassified Streptomyces TaxID=2593676 RepID=UPI0016533173|nr:hypothetical protein [Streptomyces sp. sk2.1]
MTARTQIGGVPVPGDGPAALPGADGSVELFHRAAAKAAPTTVRTGRTAAVSVSAAPGTGPSTCRASTGTVRWPPPVRRAARCCSAVPRRG